MINEMYTQCRSEHQQILHPQRVGINQITQVHREQEGSCETSQ